MRFGQSDHKRSYGADLPALMHASGFDVEVFNTCDWYAQQPEFASSWRHLRNPEYTGKACEMHTIVRRPRKNRPAMIHWGANTSARTQGQHGHLQ